MAPLADEVDRLRAALADTYLIEDEAGSGGMATVYRATDRKHGRTVALKVLRPELAHAMGPQRFLREIGILSKLTHPNVLPLLDSGEVSGFVYYVMPFVSGESLRQRMQREVRLPVEDALRITREVADALAYAHAQGVIHRDIKPENILLESGHAVVADFGIARTVSAAGVDVTSGGLAIGTPAYMSPEQWEAGQVDGRADLYSLGCVLYEMLSGSPPFMGADAQSVAALHRMETPRPLRITRPTVPAGVQVLVDRLLAKSPADRLQTADELVAALTGSATPATVQVARARRRWLVPALALAAVVAAVLYWRGTRGPPLDEDRFVVLPFRHRGEAAPQLVNGDMCESLIYEALARWRDLPVANSLLVRDAINRRGGEITSLAGGLDLARSLLAGRLLWGEVWESGDTTVVRAAVYDAADGRVLHEETMRALPGAIGPSFAALADTLVVRSAGLTARVEAGIGTQSFTALREFAAAHAAIARWDLTQAAERLTAAVAADPSYPQAHLHLAQIAQWQGFPASTWRDHVTAAVGGGWLSARDSVLAMAMLDVAGRRYQESCDRYRALLARDSLDFAAWYGLGECQIRNRTVVRDAASASGWRFASSGHAAVVAYTRALTLVPSVHLMYQGAALGRLQELLYANAGDLRLGIAAEGADTMRFAAFPSLVADTLAFVPWPAADVFGGRPEAVPATRSQALARNRGVLRRLAESWVRAYPQSLPALETYVLALEANGDLGSTVQGMPTALEAAQRMRALAPHETYRRDAMLWETRLLVKQGEFARARALADSLLRGVDRTVPQAHRFAGAAALTGRVQLAADLLAEGAPTWTPVTADTRPVEVPVPVRADALRLMAYAAFGVPAESLAALSRRVRSGIATYVAPADRPAAESALLHRAAAIGFPALDTVAVAGDYLLEMERALRRGDLASVRARFGDIAAARRGQRPGDLAFEIMFLETRLRLAAGDSAAAVTHLDEALDALASFGSGLLSEVPPAAAIGRALALRAELAAGLGDARGAAMWAGSVLTLWSDADPSLAPAVARMRQLGNRN